MIMITARKYLRRLARYYLLRSWRATLPYAEQVRLDHWGATGNPAHHPFAFVDSAPEDADDPGLLTNVGMPPTGDNYARIARLRA